MTTNQIRRDYTLILTVSATLVLLMPLRAKCSLPYAACGRQQRHDMPTHTAAVSPLSAYDQHRLIGDVLSGDHHTDPLPGPLSTSGSIDFDFEYRNRNAGTPHVRNRRSATVNDTRPDTVTIVNSSLHQPVASSNYHRQPKVVGGSLALDGEFPWAVSIRKYEQHHCGGVILNRHWILTAAHCVQSALSSQYTVRVGLSCVTHFVLLEKKKNRFHSNFSYFPN